MTTAQDFRDVVDLMIDARRRISQLEREVARNQVGTVCDVDPAKGYRLQFGTDDGGNPKKSPWLPHPEHGGSAKTWMPLSVGQVAMMVAPPGDPRKAVLLRAGFSGESQPPSQSLDEHVFQFGESKIVVKEDRIVLAVGESTLTITEADIVALVGRTKMTLADKDITIKARRHYLRGKVAAGLNYSDNAKEFPSQAKLAAGDAKNLFGKINGDDIPDDD